MEGRFIIEIWPKISGCVYPSMVQMNILGANISCVCFIYNHDICMNLFNIVLYEPYNVTVCSLDFIPVIEGGTCDPIYTAVLLIKKCVYPLATLTMLVKRRLQWCTLSCLSHGTHPKHD